MRKWSMVEEQVELEDPGMRTRHGSEGLQFCTLSQAPEAGARDGHEGSLCLGAASPGWGAGVVLFSWGLSQIILSCGGVLLSGQNHKILKLESTLKII